MAVSSAITGATGSTSSSTTKSNAIAGNFDQFLQLLTTQLKNQSPLDPLDTNQFTEQLVQFAGVEQQLKSNETLSALLSLTKATTATNAVSFIGSTITADGAASQLAGGKAEWQIAVPRAGTANVTISKADGTVVATAANVALKAGSQSYVWNGKTSTGAAAPDGDYVITVTAKDGSAQAMSATTEVKGVVDGVDITGSTPSLKIGAISVAVDKVKTVVRAQ